MWLYFPLLVLQGLLASLWEGVTTSPMEKCSMFPKEVGIPFPTWSPHSQGTTPVYWKWQSLGLLCIPDTTFL